MSLSLTSFFTFLTNAAGMHSWLTGLRTGQQMKELLTQLERTESRIRGVELEVQKISDSVLHLPTIEEIKMVNVSKRIEDRRQLARLLEPVAHGLGGPILSTAVIEPTDLGHRISGSLADVLMQVRRLSEVQPQSDPNLVPVLFFEGGVGYLGWQTRGLLKVLLGCEYNRFEYPIIQRTADFFETAAPLPMPGTIHGTDARAPAPRTPSLPPSNFHVSELPSLPPLTYSWKSNKHVGRIHPLNGSDSLTGPFRHTPINPVGASYPVYSIEIPETRAAHGRSASVVRGPGWKRFTLDEHCYALRVESGAWAQLPYGSSVLWFCVSVTDDVKAPITLELKDGVNRVFCRKETLFLTGFEGEFAGWQFRLSCKYHEPGASGDWGFHFSMGGKRNYPACSIDHPWQHFR